LQQGAKVYSSTGRLNNEDNFEEGA
jgi:hypothetical protein